LLCFSIEKIKEKRAQDLHDERVNAPDPDCPFGHVKVDNDKRLSTLRQLELSKKSSSINLIFLLLS
jgi:hypothetical protein